MVRKTKKNRKTNRKTKKNRKNIIKLNKSTKLNNKFKKLNCSPSKKLNFTCYSPNSLIKLKEEWNKDNKHQKIHSNDPYIIWSTLKQYLEKTCHNEKCWLSQKFISDNLA